MSINFLYNSENVQEDSLLPLTLPSLSTSQLPPNNLFINSITDIQNEPSSLLTFSPLHSFTLNPICPVAKNIYNKKIKSKNLIKFIYCDKGKKVKKLKI